VKSPNIRYVPAVDHLRAFAATLIVFYHGLQLFGGYFRTGREDFDGHWIFSRNPILTLIEEGHSAVSLFIVLSGFIFTYGATGREISYRQFITNRLWRIAPLFYLVVVFGIHTFEQDFNLLALVQTLAFLGDLPGALVGGPLLGIAWAIAVEFRCYLVFPFLLRLGDRYGLRYFAGILAVTLGFRILHFISFHTVRDLSYLTIVGRLDQFVIGMVAATLFGRLERHRKILRWSFPVATSLALGWLWWFNQDGGWQADKLNRIFWPTIEGGVWALVIVTYVAFDRATGQPANWLSLFVARLGQISFSTYLLHFTMIMLLIHLKWVVHPSPDPVRNALLCTALEAWPLTVMVSVLTYNVIERPFMAFRKRYLVPVPASAPGPVSAVTLGP
jgi:peptidoglycan/LPS O-acetylase OafA/YrhL